MKIKINEYSDMNIKVKEQYEPEEFFAFLDHLETISKMIKKDFLTAPSTPSKPDEGFKVIKSKRDGKLTKIFDTKEKAVKLNKIAYFGTTEEKEKFAKENGYPDWEYLRSSSHYLRIKYKIKPRDVGLKRWLKGKERSMPIETRKEIIDSLRIK